MEVEKGTKGQGSKEKFLRVKKKKQQKQRPNTAKGKEGSGREGQEIS